MANTSYVIGLAWLLFHMLIVQISQLNASPMIEGGSNEKLSCPITQNCHCSYGMEYDIACPSIEYPNISVRVEPQRQNYRVEFECNTIDDKIYKKLPEWNIGDANVVKFKWCPMPVGTPIKRILEHLGIKAVQSLTLTSRSDVSIVRQHLSGLNSLTRLGFNGFGLTNLPEDLFEDVANISSLDLRSNKVHLPVNIFQNLHKLEFLELGFNNLSTLEDGIFRNLKILKHLNLWGNNLQNLTKEAFREVTSNVELDLSSNNMNTLRPDIFEYLVNMTTINLSANRFTSLPEGIFHHNKKLSQIRFLNNRVQLEALPNGFLSHLPALKEVLIQCNLSIVPENLFTGSPNITRIVLKQNALRTLPRRLFGSQEQLIELDLSNNQLISLNDDLFENTPNLVILRLSNNKLQDISQKLLSDLNDLKELYLDNNKLESIHLHAFEGTNLRVLHLQNNYLDFINFAIHPSTMDKVSPFQNLHNLKILNLSHNRLMHFLNDWDVNILSLEQLDLSYNNISTIAFDQLGYLWRNDIIINLAYNQIKTITADRFINKNISSKSTWILKDNPLKCDCIILYFVKFLRGDLGPVSDSKVNFDIDNLVCAQPNNLKGRTVESLMPNELLCPLDAPNTKYKFCPEKCSCWVRANDRTVIFNCSNAKLNEVPTLPDIKNKNLDIFELYLENNNITSLPSANKDGFKYVTKIYARNNSISACTPENIPSNLSLLDMSENKLKWLNDTLFTHLNRTKTLKQIKLGMNPWTCDCLANSFRKFIQTQFQTILDLDKIKCTTGERLIDRNDLCPQNPTLVILISVAIALLGLFIGIAAAAYYKYQQEIKVWLFAHNLCMWFVTEEELDKDKKYDAFISFSHKDEDFVTEQLVPELENGSHPFKICLHFRDWVVGEFIPTQISRSVEESRRTLIVLSPNFLDSIWARMEFQAAHKKALAEGCARVIVIIYGDIGDIEKLDPELKLYLKTNTYIKWGDPWFFDKLRFAMPHPTNYKSKGLIKSTMKSSIDDKLELIKPQSVTPPLTTPPAEQAGNNPLIGKLNAENGKYLSNGLNSLNGHVNGAFIINTNAKQSDV